MSAVLPLTIGLYDAFSILTWILPLIALARNGHCQLGVGLSSSARAPASWLACLTVF